MLKIPKLNLKNFLILIFVGAPVVIGGFLAIAHYTTTNPKFCLSCHAIGDTPNVGMGSGVHPPFARVACIECHAKSQATFFAFRIIDGYREGYSADPERVSVNCERCHKEVLENGVEKYKHNVMNIKIPHKKHLEEGMLCVDCHRNITHDKGKQKTYRPKMEQCMKCHDHFKADCYSCHVKETLALPLSDNVSEEKCTGCHEGFIGKSYEIYNLSFIHPLHLDNNLDCNTCHSNNTEHGSVIDKDSCDNCHGVELPHAEDWVETLHKREAKKDMNACKKCHSSEFCVGCHKIEIPHVRNWKSTHSKTARQDPALCAKCHQQQAICKTCHGLTLPHPDSWLGTHFETAKKNVLLCAKCHKSNDKCAVCHESGIKPSTHDGSSWMIEGHPVEVKTKGKYCLMCHEAEYCTMCHPGQ